MNSGSGVPFAQDEEGAAAGDERGRRKAVVAYHSTNLESTMPELATAVERKDLEKCAGIRRAHNLAEKVREKFKQRTKTEREAMLRAPTGGASEEQDKAIRYDRRLKMNRQSAAASRVRREAYIRALETVLYQSDGEHKALMAALEAERSANQNLSRQLEVARRIASPQTTAPNPPPVPQVVLPPTIPTAAASIFSSVEVKQEVSPLQPSPPMDVDWGAFEQLPDVCSESLLFGVNEVTDSFDFTATDPMDPQIAIDHVLDIDKGAV